MRGRRKRVDGNSLHVERLETKRLFDGALPQDAQAWRSDAASFGEVLPSAASSSADFSLTPLLNSQDSFQTYFRQGDNRGEFFYDAQAATLRSSGPYELARFVVGRRWTEFQFEVKVSSLSFGNFEFRLSNSTSQYVIKLNGAVSVGPDWRTVRIAYDEGSRTLNAFVDGTLCRQSSVVTANWNTSFDGTFFSGGGQNAEILVRNAGVGVPVSDTAAPAASFRQFASPLASGISSASLSFSEPVSGVKSTQFTLRRNGVPLSGSSFTVAGTGASYTLSGLGSLTSQVGAYTLQFEDVLGEVRDSYGNTTKEKAVLSWSVVGQEAVGGVSVLDSRESFWTYFRQGDNRGEILYDAQAATLRSSGPYELTRFVVGRRWTEFQFEVKVSSLSFGNFEIRLSNGTNQYVIKLDGALSVGPDWRTVRIAYDEGSRTLNAFVDDTLCRQSSVVTANWNMSFDGTFFSGGGQNAEILLRNARVGSPASVPGSPMNVTGTASNVQVGLAWQAPAYDGAAVITDYVVQYSSNGGTAWETFADGTNTNTSMTVTGLQNGVAYVFRVAAVNALGVGAFSATAAPLTPRTVPGSPTNLIGSPGNAQVGLTWQPPATNGGAVITDYVVQYSSNGGASWETFAEGKSTSTSTLVTGLHNGIEYVFRVAAVNESGVGAPSASSKTIAPRTVPGSPTNVVGTPGNGTVGLTWQLPVTNGGAAITDYVVQYSSNGGTAWETFADGTNTNTSTTVTGLQNGVAHVFRIAALNSLGVGAFSVTAASLTPRTLPGSPTNVIGTPGNAQVGLTWQPPVTNGGAAITDYVVQYSSSGGTAWETFADGTNTSKSTTVTGLQNGVAYVFRVAAVNVSGVGAFSATAAPLTPRTVPGLPTNVIGTPGNAQVGLTWEAPATDGSAAITDYVVQYSSSGGTAWETFADGTTTSTSTTVTGLQNGVAYVFRVAAVNVSGVGAFSATAAPLTPRTVPGSPTNVIGTPGNAQVGLTWQAPASNGGAAITDYFVRYSSDNGVTWVRFNDPVSSSPTATVTGLTNGVAYVFKVSAITMVGAGLPSSGSIPVTPRSAPPAPTGLVGTQGNGQVILTWAAPISDGGAVLTDYEVQLSSNNGLTWTTFSDGVSASTTATVTGLANGVSYVFKVRAVNAAGPGEFSLNSIPVTPRTVPAVPTTLKAVAGRRSATLSWKAPTQSGGASVSDYVIQYSKNKGASWMTFTDALSNATSTLVTGLSPGVSYVFRVAAVNEAGVGAFTSKSAAVVPRS